MKVFYRPKYDDALIDGVNGYLNIGHNQHSIAYVVLKDYTVIRNQPGEGGMSRSGHVKGTPAGDAYLPSVYHKVLCSGQYDPKTKVMSLVPSETVENSSIVYRDLPSKLTGTLQKEFPGVQKIHAFGWLGQNNEENTMKRFSETLTEGMIRIDHIEDYWISNPDEYKTVISIFDETLKQLAGNTSTSLNITVKVDGSPAIIFGTHPKTGEFIIATKSIFNKEPKYYTSVEDIHKNAPKKEVGDILANAFPYLKQIDTKGKLLQCDLMFDNRILKKKRIDGVSYYVFEPNTIAYAIPITSHIGDQIGRASIGVSIHTELSGDINRLRKSPIDASRLHLPISVWNCPVKIRSHAGIITFTKKQTQTLEKHLDYLRSTGGKNKARITKTLARLPHFTKTFVSYSNEELRGSNTRLLLTANKYNRYLKSIYKTHVSLDEKEMAEIDEIIKYYQTILSIKNMLIQKLDNISSLDTFVSTPEGFEVIGQEGFVISDIKSGNIFKFVDKMTFTKMNMLSSKFRNTK